MFTPGLKLSRAACHGDMVVACPRDDDVAAPADRDVVVLAAESDGVGAVADRNVRPAGRPEDGEIGVAAVDRVAKTVDADRYVALRQIVLSAGHDGVVADAAGADGVVAIQADDRVVAAGRDDRVVARRIVQRGMTGLRPVNFSHCMHLLPMKNMKHFWHWRARRPCCNARNHCSDPFTEWRGKNKRFLFLFQYETGGDGIEFC